MVLTVRVVVVVAVVDADAGDAMLLCGVAVVAGVLLRR